MILIEGLIVKGIGGFYYVEASDKIYECKAKGIFRKNNQKPMIGDKVIISILEDGFVFIDKIMERKNSFIRPPVANIDQLVILSSVCDPYPNFYVIDKMISLSCYKEVKPILIISKVELHNADDIIEVYKSSSIDIIEFSSVTGQGIEQVKKLFYNNVTAVIGNSGVGKSTLLNCISPELNINTDKISYKLGRGKHTTRNVELYKVNNGYVADTPGFSTVDIGRYETIKKNELQFCFNEFLPFIGKCKFKSCTHTKETGCKIIEEVSKGKINSSRYNSYIKMYEEVKDLKEWNTR